MNRYDKFLERWFAILDQLWCLIVGRCCATLFLVSMTLFLLSVPGYAAWWFFFSN